MRVLFTTWAWPSHYFPMVPLAWALRAAGHEVRMTSQPELLPTMRASGLPSTIVGRDLDVSAVFAGEPGGRAHTPSPARADKIADDLIGDLANAARVHDAATVRAIGDEARHMFRTLWAQRALARGSRLSVYGGVAGAMVDDLLAFARSWKPDVIVYDALTFAGPLVARLLGVPAVRSLFGPDVTYFVRAAHEAGMAELLERFDLDDLDLVGVASLDQCPPSLQVSDDIAPTRRLRTSYVPYNGLPEVPSWLLDTPAKPRICLTWGTSVDRLHGGQAFMPGDVLQGSAKLADERGAELVLAITPRQRPLLTELPPDVRIVEGVPLDALLPTCQAIIHQGGAGTTLTALRHGLPQVILPQLVDQAANACRLLSTGAGRARSVTGLTASDLLTAGHELLDNPSYRAAAGNLRQEILDLPSPADVVGELADLISP